MEFYCENCGQLLTLSEAAAGQEVQCPLCEATFTLPAHPASQNESSLSDFRDTDESGFAPAGSGGAEEVDPNANPYAPPSTPAGQMRTSFERGEIRPSVIDVSDVINRSWRAFKGQMGMAVGVFLLVTVVNNVIGQTTSYVLERLTENLGISGLLLGYSLLLAGVALQTFFNIGQLKIMLQIARGQTAQFNSLFSGEKLVLPVYAASILYFLIVVVGLLLLVVPGIILALMYSQFYLLMVDGRAGIMQSFSQSQELMRGNKLSIFVLGLVCFALTMLGLLACLIGFFFTGAFCSVIIAMAYLRITGQPCVE
jgi:uncharacterized membrane protein